ncbi:hypothetical protein ADL26_19970 [Thermoactinomyces vulgaris]|jgi:hypothetical protein|nr:hypothetical protein ADL26_19970 [Thermoactinomyces vulgaris]
MVKHMSRLGCEILLVVGILIALKNGFFPWMISMWYPNPLLSEKMGEWTAIIIGVGTCLLYMGLGSAAKHAHALTPAQMIGTFGLLHGTFFLPFPQWLEQIIRDWQGLLDDMLALFLPGRMFTSFELFGMLLGMFILGRLFYVREDEPRHLGQAQRQEKKLPSSTT